MNSSMSTHEVWLPARLAGDPTTSALRDHFPRRRLTAPLPASPTMAAIVGRIAGVS